MCHKRLVEFWAKECAHHVHPYVEIITQCDAWMRKIQSDNPASSEYCRNITTLAHKEKCVPNSRCGICHADVGPVMGWLDLVASPVRGETGRPRT